MQNSQPQQKNQKNPMEYIYIRIVTCPCCTKDFADFAIKRSRLRVINMETDNKTNYHDLDPNFYEVMFCTVCGYAALRSVFEKITSKQQEMIEAKITPKFRMVEHDVPLTAKAALERYRQALLCAEAINGKTSQKAFIQLRMAWILRDIGKTAEEATLIGLAFGNLKNAFQSERFPIGNMDEINAKYLIAELARRLGEYREALRWISDVIVADGVPSGLRERARNVKELIRENALLAAGVQGASPQAQTG